MELKINEDQSILVISIKIVYAVWLESNGFRAFLNVITLYFNTRNFKFHKNVIISS